MTKLKRLNLPEGVYAGIGESELAEEEPTVTQSSHDPHIPVLNGPYENFLPDEKTAVEYREFVEWANKVIRGGSLHELSFKLPAALQKKVDFIRELATSIGYKLKDILKIFLNKYVFAIFSFIGWSFTKLWDLVKKGHYYYLQVQKVFIDFMHRSKLVKWSEDKLADLDQFLQNHPVIKRISGVAVAALLIYLMYTAPGTFTGHVMVDFDLSNAVEALKGRFSLTDLFASPEGLHYLSLLALGMSTGVGVAFPFKGIANLIVATVITLAKYLKVSLSRAGDKENETELRQLGIEPDPSLRR